MTGSRPNALSLLAGFVVFAFATLAGCGIPQPAPLPESPAATERYGAPVVTNPRDVSVVLAAPCQRLLDQSDLRMLRIIQPGRPRSYLGSNQCSWTTQDDDLLALAVDDNRDLLVDTYRARLTPVFVPTTVEGMPAVRQKTSDAYNSCTVTVGLGPRQAIEADWNGLAPASSASDPCAQAERALAVAIRKLPPRR